MKLNFLRILILIYTTLFFIECKKTSVKKMLTENAHNQKNTSQILSKKEDVINKSSLSVNNDEKLTTRFLHINKNINKEIKICNILDYKTNDALNDNQINNHKITINIIEIKKKKISNTINTETNNKQIEKKINNKNFNVNKKSKFKYKMKNSFLLYGILILIIYYFLYLFEQKANINCELSTPVNILNAGVSLQFTKIIWILWLQGWNSTNIPKVVTKSYDSWEYYNKNDGWKIIKLDKYNIQDYFGKNFKFINRNLRRYKIQALSDIIRINLLNKYGGVWVDATVFCNKRLDDWILPYWDNNKFFAFSNEDIMISSWFLVSRLNGTYNYIISKWYYETMHFWFVNHEKNQYKTREIDKKSLKYFWFHHLFKNLYENDNKFRYVWNSTLPKISSDYNEKAKVNPQIFVKEDFTELPNYIKDQIDNKLSPVYKLTYKTRKFPSQNNSAYKYLFSTIE